MFDVFWPTFNGNEYAITSKVETSIHANLSLSTQEKRSMQESEHASIPKN